MSNKNNNWYYKIYPQNYILKNPLKGSILIILLVYSFMIIYQPLNPNDQKIFRYEIAMAIYCVLSGATSFLTIIFLKKIKYFSSANNWCFLKEIQSIAVILFNFGLIVFLSGYYIEVPTPTMNLTFFLISLKHSFLLSIIPFAFFTIINIHYLLSSKSLLTHTEEKSSGKPENLIHIKSKLKSEELYFYPDELVYIEADGNYVTFYLIRNNLIKKEIIRNSISNIEEQLADIPQFLRIHRAYIVNLNKVHSKQGNSLGYRLTLKGTDNEIFVSRQNTRNFDTLFVRFCS